MLRIKQIKDIKNLTKITGLDELNFGIFPDDFAAGYNGKYLTLIYTGRYSYGPQFFVSNQNINSANNLERKLATAGYNTIVKCWNEDTGKYVSF